MLVVVASFSACTFNGKLGDDDIIIIEEPPFPEFEQFSFEYPIRLELDSAVLQIGDTLTLEVEIPNNQLINLFNRDTVTFYKPNVSFNLSLIKLDNLGNNNVPPLFVNYFLVESLSNQFIQFQSTVSWSIAFGCPSPGENMRFKILIMPITSGTYALELPTAFVQWGPGIFCAGNNPNGEVKFGELSLFFYPFNPRLDLVHELPQSVQDQVSFLFPGHPSLINRRVVFFKVI
ncbi:MAG: hypothetical protein DHS20C18_52250 [Saprospiraceae bacterium]|nr:MAG: hypothetical protein DHS20C18_52250 [Saprospiraceae bacterium]